MPENSGVSVAPTFTLGDRVRPVNGRVAVRIETKAERTAGGIIVPRDVTRSVHDTRPTYGWIVQLSSDLEDDTDLKLGDLVCFGRYNGVKIEWQNPDDRNDKQEVVILAEQDILCVLYDTDEEAAVNVRVRS